MQQVEQTSAAAGKQTNRERVAPCRRFNQGLLFFKGGTTGKPINSQTRQYPVPIKSGNAKKTRKCQKSRTGACLAPGALNSLSCRRPRASAPRGYDAGDPGTCLRVRGRSPRETVANYCDQESSKRSQNVQISGVNALSQISPSACGRSGQIPQAAP